MKNFIKIDISKKISTINDFWIKVKKFRTALLILLVLTFISFLLRELNVWSLQDMWSNISAGFVSSIVTLFVIDVLLEKRKRDEMKDAENVSMTAIKQLSNLMVTYPMQKIGFSPDKAIFESIGKNRGDAEQIGNRLVAEMLDTAIETGFIQEALDNMNSKEWTEFKNTLMKVRESIEDNLRLFASLYDSILLGKLLKVYQAYRNFELPFEVFLAVLIDTTVDYKKEAKHILTKNMSYDLINYFKKVKELKIVLDKDYKSVSAFSD